VWEEVGGGKQPVMVNSALECGLVRDENPSLQAYKSCLLSHASVLHKQPSVGSTTIHLTDTKYTSPCPALKNTCQVRSSLFV